MDGSVRFLGSGMIVGDLHIDDTYTGRHTDYLANCWKFCAQITQAMKDNNVTHLFLCGDLVGVKRSTHHIRNREILFVLMKQLQLWKDLTNGHVYCLKGNHDFCAGMSDYDMLLQLGYFECPAYVDMDGVRFHLFNYGDETRKIEVDPNRYNVAVVHNNMMIEGLTTWYKSGGEGIELSTLENLAGVELVVAGHIHDPSQRLVETSIGGTSVSLFYPGCGTRPTYDANVWESVFGVLLRSDNGSVTLNQVAFELTPASELWKETPEGADEAESEEEVGEEPHFDIEALSKILSELECYNINDGLDYRSQINRLAGIDREAAELAIRYIDDVQAELK